MNAAIEVNELIEANEANGAMCERLFLATLVTLGIFSRTELVLATKLEKQGLGSTPAVCWSDFFCEKGN